MHYLAIPKIEYRLMPRAFDTVAVERALLQRAAGVVADRANRTYQAAVVIDQHWRAVDLHTPGLVRPDLAQRQHRGPVLGRGCVGSMVDADTQPVDHIAAKRG